jgi:hypothetical protein
MMKRFAIVTLLLVASGCATSAPPLLAPTPPRRSLEARYARMRVRVASFHDRTTLAGGVSSYDTGPFFRSGSLIVAAPGSNILTSASDAAGGVAATTAPGAPMALSAQPAGGPALIQTVPDALMGILGQSGRFELLESATEQCDTKLVGAITAVKDNTATLEMRLVSCAYEADMAAVSVPVRFTEGAGTLAPNREDLLKAVLTLVGELPDPRDIRAGEVVSRRGNIVTVNLGRNDRVVKGMAAFTMAPADPVTDPRTGEVIKDQIITGELYIFAIEDKSCTAYIVQEHPSVTLVGDNVVFK